MDLDTKNVLKRSEKKGIVKGLFLRKEEQMGQQLKAVSKRKRRKRWIDRKKAVVSAIKKAK